MSFLYPSFLFALGAIAIPIIIHLFNFRRYKTVYFSNTKFLREVKEKTDSRSQLKHLLVLLCRILAITFLVFAFAQPYIKRGVATETAGKKTVSIFIDNSFSMGQTQSDVPLLEIAKRKAAEIVAAENEDDLFQLLTNDFEGRQQRLVDKQEMLNEIKEVQLSPSTRYMSEIINRQKEALAKGSGPRFSYVISDFQKSFSDFNNVQKDTILNLSFVPLHSREAGNVYIDTCWFQSPVQVAGQTSLLFVRLMNHSPNGIENGRLTLKTNNEIKAISDFSIDANGVTTNTIRYNITEKGWNRAELSLIDHPITFDDVYYLTYLVSENEAVMVINENSENPFLNALFGKNDFFRLQNVAFNQLKYDDIMKQQLVIINGVKQLSSGLSSQLKTFLENGGSVCVFPDATSDLVSYNSFLGMMKADALGNYETVSKQVTTVNTHDPVFSDVFQRVSENITLPKVTSGFASGRKSLTSAEPLLTCNDGSSLLTKYSTGKGLLYVSTVPLNKDASDLPLSPIFAPLMYNIAVVRAYAPANAYAIGEQNMASVNVDSTANEQMLQLKGPTSEFIPAQRRIGNSMNIFLDNNIKQAGFYELGENGGQPRAWFAMNYNRNESDLTFLSNDELQKVSEPLKAKVFTNTDRDLGAFITGQQQGLPLWKIAVILALLFLGTEIALLKLWR